MTKKVLATITLLSMNLIFISHVVFCQLHEIILTKPIAVIGSNAENASAEQSFYWPLSVDFDHSGNIYILDSGNQRVVKFDKNFSFVKEFGRQGQGPGEFSFRPGMINSGTMKIHLNKIYIVDNISRRVQIFSDEGNYINSFHTFGTTGNIDVDSNGNLYLTSIEGDKDGHLINVYDCEGNFQNSFAQKMIEKVNRKFPTVNESKLCLLSDDFLFLGFDHFPIIRKYNTSGKLLFEKVIDFSSAESKKMAKEKQYDLINPASFEKNPGKKLYKMIIKGIQSSAAGGCYVLISNRIFLLDANGKTVKIYTIQNKKFPIFRFAVNEKEKRLYALDTVRNHRLSVYDLSSY